MLFPSPSATLAVLTLCSSAASAKMHLPSFSNSKHSRAVANLQKKGPTPQELYERAHSKAALAAERRDQAKRDSSSWVLAHNSNGSTFFDDWQFYSDSDPTNGAVEYVTYEEAAASGLIEESCDGNAVMSVDSTNQTVTTGRRSVRISSTYTFEVGTLVIMDAVHMPAGCGTWPAFWALGSGTWPAGGEIDILEGVNDFTANEVSIHTAVGCTISETLEATAALLTGSFTSTDCSAANTSNQGCGFRSNSSATHYGSAFNTAGGGVYAMSITSDGGISVWHFSRSSIPSDITDGAPDPSSWGTPMASYPAASCTMSDYFKTMGLVFDTTFCGDWAGSSSVWSSIQTDAGQTESCATSTGYDSCDAYVLANGDKFTEAYWEVASVKVYTQK